MKILLTFLFYIFSPTNLSRPSLDQVAQNSVWMCLPAWGKSDKGDFDKVKNQVTTTKRIRVFKKYIFDSSELSGFLKHLAQWGVKIRQTVISIISPLNDNGSLYEVSIGNLYGACRLISLKFKYMVQLCTFNNACKFTTDWSRDHVAI